MVRKSLKFSTQNFRCKFKGNKSFSEKIDLRGCLDERKWQIYSVCIIFTFTLIKFCNLLTPITLKKGENGHGKFLDANIYGRLLR